MEIENLTEITKEITDLLRKLKPYGKIELALNQDGSQLSMILNNSEKYVIMVKEKKYDPGPCYRCHQWPCDCKEGPLMENPNIK